MLYMWNNDKIADYEQGELEWTGEWVATDPGGMNGEEGSADISSYIASTPNPVDYETGVTVIISEQAPTNGNDGFPVQKGNLWWSPLSGRMYIYYGDTDSDQWVVTNPSGVLLLNTHPINSLSVMVVCTQTISRCSPQPQQPINFGLNR